MARIRCPIVVLGPDGKPLAGASVETKKRPAGTLAETFVGETGNTTASNPATSDEHGKVTVWVPPGSYESVVSATGMVSYTEMWDAVSGAEGGIAHSELEKQDRERLEHSGASSFTTFTLLNTTKTKLPGTGVMKPQWRFEQGDAGPTKGVVRLRGSILVNAGQTVLTTDALVQLPVGSRPARAVKFRVAIAAGGIGLVIDEEGHVFVSESLAGAGEIWLDGVTFPLGGETS